SPKRSKKADARRLYRAKEEIIELIPRDEPFIMVDEEQLRTEMPHARALPFLEKDGQYWGPPADDDTAISEFERMREGGARYIAFTWPTFWWLGYYSRFHEHLRAKFPCLEENERVIVFDLRTAN